MRAWTLASILLAPSLVAAAPVDAQMLSTQYTAAEGKQGPDQQRATLELAQNLLGLKLPAVAFGYFATLFKEGPKRPYYGAAVEGLVEVQRQLNDEYLIPSALAGQEQEAFAVVPEHVYPRLAFLVAVVEQRKGEFQKARANLEAVPKSSPVYAKARYLLGIVLGDPRYPGSSPAAQAQGAVAAFSEVLGLRDSTQEDLPTLQKLSQLGLGRTLYGSGRYGEAVKAYESIPRFSTYWDQALLENGFARFRAGDAGGALGSLQALHAPQYANLFQPESWILKGTIYFFSCLYEETKASLAEFHRVYDPVLEKLKPLATDSRRDLSDYYRLVADRREDVLPRPVLLWIRSNERMLGLFRMVEEQNREKALLSSMRELQGTAAQGGLLAALDENRAAAFQVAGQVAKNRVVEAYRNLKGFSDQAQIISFETSKADKENVEQGFDQRAALAHQRIHRPQSRGESWDYWKFDGEFWIDEIGNYQYTLKNGCLRKNQ